MTTDKVIPNTPDIDNADYLLNLAEELGFGEFHVKIDKPTGLKAIIAIHNTKLGPALGGCRCIEYSSTGAAIIDALRLARGMSFKSAMAGLSHGGGKAVLIKPPVIVDRKAYFEAFAQFVHELGGRYITAKDSGTSMEDMDIIATKTPYVCASDKADKIHSDPSLFTALGILRGIQAAVKFKLGRDDMEGLHIALQGAGSVGYDLAKDLHKLGVRLTVCDKDQNAVQRCVDEFGAAVVAPDAIYSVPCDVFSPCALGAILNDRTIPLLQTTIVAGGANNQLADKDHGHQLWERGILYAPDYVINAGGVIYAATKYDHKPDDIIKDKIQHLYDVLLTIFERSKRENLPTNVITGTMAREKLQ